MPTQQSRQSGRGGKKMESRTEEAKVELLVVGEMVLVLMMTTCAEYGVSSEQ
jgi:hypothetical protein